jgi:hypothetical protein
MLYALPWTQHDDWIERYLYNGSKIAGWVWVRQYPEENGLMMWCTCFWTVDEIVHNRGYVETEAEGKNSVDSYLSEHGIRLIDSKLACLV